MVCLLAARASRTENQDAIDAAIVGVLADPKEVLHMLLERVLNLVWVSCGTHGCNMFVFGGWDVVRTCRFCF